MKPPGYAKVPGSSSEQDAPSFRKAEKNLLNHMFEGEKTFDSRTRERCRKEEHFAGVDNLTER
ncbi:hypothetical protein NST48_23820 [Paenibacillus sp. FSL M7-0547]|uniref:hypothetical protein n=1 Tax=Paenibacillus sp. FSL M7-0547 TaxID=2954755 RepID=UPI0030F8934A